MLIFEYEALSSEGQEVKGEIEALSTNEAISKMRDKGLFPTKVRPKGVKDDANKVKPDSILKLFSRKLFFWGKEKNQPEGAIEKYIHEHLELKSGLKFSPELKDKIKEVLVLYLIGSIGTASKKVIPSQVFGDLTKLIKLEKDGERVDQFIEEIVSELKTLEMAQIQS